MIKIKFIDGPQAGQEETSPVLNRFMGRTSEGAYIVKEYDPKVQVAIMKWQVFNGDVPTDTLVRFEGGPRDGKEHSYPRNPISVGCVTEAHSMGMHGLYRETNTYKGTAHIYRWQELPRGSSH